MSQFFTTSSKRDPVMRLFWVKEAPTGLPGFVKAEILAWQKEVA